MLWALRFFRIVPLHSDFMLGGLAGLGAFGVTTLIIDSGRGLDAVAPIVFLHMFAVSSGFLLPARRGHFDLVLTGGSTPMRVALVHWLVSIAPGVAMWLLVGTVELALSAGAHATAFTNGTIAAMAMISTVGWALTVPMPRLSGGVMWLVVLFIALAASGSWRAALLTVADAGGSVWSLGLMFTLCPVLLVGATLRGAELLALTPGFVAAVALVAVAMVWICQADLRLEAAQ